MNREILAHQMMQTVERLRSLFNATLIDDEQFIDALEVMYAYASLVDGLDELDEVLQRFAGDTDEPEREEDQAKPED